MHCFQSSNAAIDKEYTDESNFTLADALQFAAVRFRSINCTGTRIGRLTKNY